MNNPSEQISSMSQFEKDIDNLPKSVDEGNKNMDNFNQSLTNVVNNEINSSYDDKSNFINEGMNQDSSAIASPREEERAERAKGSRNHSQHDNINEVTKFNDNQSTMSIHDQKSLDDRIYEPIVILPRAEQITNVLINNNDNKITSNTEIVNNLVFSKPNTSSIFDNTPNDENIVLDNYNRMQSTEIRNGNDLILSYIDKDNMKSQQGDNEIFNNNVDKESTNNDNNSERKEIMDLKTKVKQEYGRITLALKDQLTLYNKFREVIPEYVRKPVENSVGVISFIYHQPVNGQASVTSDDPMGVPQENDSDFLSSTESSSSEQNQERVKKSTRTINGYNYFIKKQFKKSKNESRRSQDIIRSSAKKWLELPANMKKYYQSKAKLRQEKASIKHRKRQQSRKPRIDTPGENESEILAVVIPINSELSKSRNDNDVVSMF